MVEAKKTIEVVARAPQAAVGVRRACPKLIFFVNRAGISVGQIGSMAASSEM